MALKDHCKPFVLGDHVEEKELAADVLWCIMGDGGAGEDAVRVSSSSASSASSADAVLRTKVAQAPAVGHSIAVENAMLGAVSEAWRIRIGIRIGRLYIGITIESA